MFQFQPFHLISRSGLFNPNDYRQHGKTHSIEFHLRLLQQRSNENENKEKKIYDYFRVNGYALIGSSHG